MNKRVWETLYKALSALENMEEPEEGAEQESEAIEEAWAWLHAHRPQ